MQGLPSVLSVFRNKFNKFNNTGQRMLDSSYHWTFKLFCYCAVGVKTSKSCQIYATLLWASFELRHEISNSVVCTTSKASDQPVHMCSLIRAFASRLNIL